MASAQENSNFFGFQDDKLIYDERKKRFVHTSDMPAMLSRQYQSSQFKSVSCALKFLPSLIIYSKGQISMDKSKPSSSGS